MPAGGLVTMGALGVGQAVAGLFGKSKAKKEAERLAASRPKYAESPYAKQGLSLAESELSTGMSGEAKNAYEQGIDRDLSTSLNAVLKGGGSVNNIAEVFGASTQGRQRLAMMKDNLRLNQINNVVRAQNTMTEEREKAFQFNEWAPWADAAKANAGARQAAENQIWGGIGTLGSAVMGIGGAAKAAGGFGQFFNSSSSESGPGLSYGNLPQRADTSGGRPNTSSVAPPFISPSSNMGVDPGLVDFSGFDLSGLPEISTFE
jgi:hypothetical protein